jgi:hypothetical protein
MSKQPATTTQAWVIDHRTAEGWTREPQTFATRRDALEFGRFRFAVMVVVPASSPLK